MFPPTFAQIEPSGECNLRCPLCLQPYRRDRPNTEGARAFMTLDMFTGLVKQLEGTKELHLQGLGEPLLNPDFFEMVEIASSLGMNVTTSSNLSILSENLARKCVTSGLSCIHISLDGATAATYERMRIGGCFDTVTENLGVLLRTKRENQGPLPRLRLTTVLTRTNLHEIPLLVELAAHYEMEEVFVQGLCHALGDSGLSAQYQSLRVRMQEQDYLHEPHGRIEEFLLDAVARARSLGVELRLPPFRHRPNGLQASCEWPQNGIYITYQGHVTPCCMVPTSDRIMLGNAASDSLDEIWNGEPYQEFRRKLASRHPPEMCCECAILMGTF